uniref:Uncharacterized protein n=1 Tax=Romanomermis culicivorax TaxID=13658 RepID=A0A915I7G8_ROMCU
MQILFDERRTQLIIKQYNNDDGKNAKRKAKKTQHHLHRAHDDNSPTKKLAHSHCYIHGIEILRLVTFGFPTADIPYLSNHDEEHRIKHVARGKPEQSLHFSLTQIFQLSEDKKGKTTFRVFSKHIQEIYNRTITSLGDDRRLSTTGIHGCHRIDIEVEIVEISLLLIQNGTWLTALNGKWEAMISSYSPF